MESGIADGYLAVRVINRTRQTVLVEDGHIASSPWSRLVGLLGRRGLAPGDGLLLKGEKAIHTLGMAFAIDVAYLDGDGRVLKAIAPLAPQRLGPIVHRAQSVLELPAGTLASTMTREGDELVVEPTF